MYLILMWQNTYLFAITFEKNLIPQLGIINWINFRKEVHMKELSGSKIRELKALAHHLNPVVQIGQKGVTENVIKAFEKAVDDHELIKVKFVDFKEDKKELSLNLSRETGAALVDIIGNVAIFYREKVEDQ